MQYMKLSTSRDFRINVSVLDSALQEHNTEDAENEPDNDQVRTHLAAFTNRFPCFWGQLHLWAVQICEIRTVCLPQVSFHFKLIVRSEQLVS